MRIRKVINKPIDVEREGARIAGAVNAVVAANVNEPGRSVSRVSSRQRIVQRNGRTEVHEQRIESDDLGEAGR
ncbi:MAG TPA: hypothetical protein VM324_13555 [Egibacteraceae bacterium]|jgi:hypothetical protein|nr:hypothetical protein [Egibacteraceae bacterium]